MPKALCITAMVLSIIVLILFLSDLLLGFAGQHELAPFRAYSKILDIVFCVCAGVMAYLSWLTFREQV